MDKQQYDEYLQSKEWKWRREIVLDFWRRSCAVCLSPHRLHIHHRNYERVGCELLHDMLVLCDKCHELYHEHTPKPPWDPIGPELRRYRKAIGEPIYG